MISVEEAKSILIENSFKLNRTIKKNINSCEGYFLAEDIFSNLDLPPFNQSNVDGYALKMSETNSRKVIREIKAGDNPGFKLRKGEAARIFTGAAVPHGADCIVMQENSIVENNKFSIGERKILKGEFIRPRGSQIREGELAIAKNTLLKPAEVGFLAAMGINNIRVYAKPKIHLIITGNELQSPGEKLTFGKVYDSNSYLLRSLLKQMNLKPGMISFVKDKKNKIKNTVSDSLKEADVILISGGISVGKYDFVNEVLDSLGLKKLFYKVSQRPGKPLYFGRKESVYVFGLPGNPASVFTCFYEYVYPLMRKIMGYENYFLTAIKLPSLEELNKNFNLGCFLKASISEHGVESLEGQASYILRTLSKANCFIYLPVDNNIVKKNELVEVHLFP